MWRERVDPYGQLTVWTTTLFYGVLLASSDVGRAENGGYGLPIQHQITASGPKGALTGTLTLPELALTDDTPVVLIVPGSGPTDRDGNSPLGISAASYAMLAEALAQNGVASVRIDKRGMFASVDAVDNVNSVTIADYGDDVLAWATAIRTRLPTESGKRCVIPLGHSEGGLVALAAMTRFPIPCGLVLVSAPGRPLADIMRQQLRDNPANTALLEQAEAAFLSLERGERVDAASLDPALQLLFAPQVQGFLIDAFRYDPAVLISKVRAPVLIVQGARDLQVGERDARHLANAAPYAELSVLADVNHVLKVVPSDDLAENLSTYADPDMPIAPGVVRAVVGFVERVASPKAAPSIK